MTRRRMRDFGDFQSPEDATILRHQQWGIGSPTQAPGLSKIGLFWMKTGRTLGKPRRIASEISRF
jgi:hypothetical protein